MENRPDQEVIWDLIDYYDDKMCEHMEKLEEYRAKLDMAIQTLRGLRDEAL